MARKIAKNEKEYKENPFIRDLIAMQTGTSLRKMTKKTGLSFFNNQTQSIEGAAVLAEEVIVDREEFVKVYAKGLSAFLELNTSGMKVFKVIYNELLGQKDKLEIYLNYELLKDDFVDKMSDRTFQRGINNCIENRIIAKSVGAGYYFVNPQFIYNGNRYYMLQRYILDESTKIVANPDTKEIELDKPRDGEGTLFETQDINPFKETPKVVAVKDENDPEGHYSLKNFKG